MNKCFICDKLLGEDDIILVKKKRIQSLMEASIKRGESQHERMLTNLETLRVHNSCQKNYTHERSINAALKRKRLSQSSLPSTSSQSSLRPPSSSSSSLPLSESEDPPALSMSCLLCDKEIPADWREKKKKKKRHLRESINSVWDFPKVKNTVLGFLGDREDDDAKEIIERIQNIPETGRENLIYHRSCYLNLKNPLARHAKRGPKCERIDDIIQGIIDFMSASNECQFKLSEILKEINSDNVHDIRTIKKYLQEKHSEDISLYECRGQDAFLLYKTTGYKALTANWYKEKKTDKQEERARVVKEAAAIVLEDIRSVFCDSENYPPSDKFLENVQSQIPATLRLFLNEIILKLKRGSTDKWERIVSSIAHAIMAATRPRTFLSTLQMGIGTFVYKKTGSKHLVDFLSSFGFSSSYHDVTQFELASIQSQQPAILPEGFCQFVFDNVDWNINTVDGYNRGESGHC